MGVVMLAFNSSTWEAEGLWVPGQPGLNSKLQGAKDYIRDLVTKWTKKETLL